MPACPASSRSHVPGLRLHRPASAEPIASATRWSIGTWPATMFVWTAEEWAGLADQPGDAREHANGVRVALRVD